MGTGTCHLLPPCSAWLPSAQWPFPTSLSFCRPVWVNGDVVRWRLTPGPRTGHRKQIRLKTWHLVSAGRSTGSVPLGLPHMTRQGKGGTCKTLVSFLAVSRQSG